jgi:hypothetical protein
LLAVVVVVVVVMQVEVVLQEEVGPKICVRETECVWWRSLWVIGMMSRMTSSSGNSGKAFPTNCPKELSLVVG